MPTKLCRLIVPTAPNADGINRQVAQTPRAEQA
ncbi:hypothetical protein DHODJN_19280 [Methylorubrum extorquens]